jgi:hypothetical protein
MTITPQPSINLLESFIPKHPNLSIDIPALWIKDISYSQQNDPDQSQREIQILLIDRQHNLDTNETYIHTVRKVLTGGSEKASTFNIDFDPIYEVIILHQLAIYREGKQVNALLPGNVRILQRELALEKHIFDGSLSLTIIFSNVKIGDIIDISYTRKGRNPVFSGHFDVIECFSYQEKIEKFSLRCVRNKDRTLHFKTYNASSSLVEQTLDHSQIETSYIVAPCKVLENFNTPNWYISHELVHLSDYQSWQEVSTWGNSLFQSDKKIEIDEIKTLVNQWKGEGKETKTALVAAALDFVQNEIRYLGIEEGIYSHQPHSPQATLSNRYGDCKDKTALLKVFMDEIEIVSIPAFVSTIHTNQLKDFLPSASMFNHVILNVKIDDESYWLDATLKYQGGSLKNQSRLFYGSYLLLNGDEECLISNPPISHPYDVDLESHYIFNSNQCELKTKTTFKQSKADEYRSIIAYHGKEGLEKLYLDFFSRKFGSAHIKEPMSLVDDLELNQITIIENYMLKDLNPDDTKFNIRLYAIPESLPDQVSLSRKEPLSLVYPTRIFESFRISSKNQHQLSSDSISLKHPSFIFDYQASQDGNDIVCTYLYETKKDHILPEDFGSLRNIISKMHETMFLDYNYNINEDLKSLGNEFVSKNKNPDRKFFSGFSIFVMVITILRLLSQCSHPHP